MKFKYLVFFIFVSLISGCSSTTTDVTTKFQKQSATQIYKGGERALARGEYRDAVEHFEALDALYPFTANAEQSQLDLMYAYYQKDDMVSTSATAERFIRLYPRSGHADYAYYMKGLANFEQERGWFHRIIATDLSARDPGTMRQSFDDFSRLVRLYPTSVYAPDARQRMIYLRNLFAAHELQVAQFYFQKKAYVAAANRANNIVQHYQGTPQVQDALGVMVKSYRQLQLPDLANQSLAVLQLNYPNGHALKDL